MSVLSIGELLGIGPSELSGLVPYSAIEGQDGSITGINGSGISGIGGGADMSAVSAVASSYAQSAASGKVDQSAFDDCCSAMSAAVSAKLDATASSQFITSTAGLQPSGDYAYNSALSGKMDTSAMTGYIPVESASSWYLTSNPSGFITGVDLSDYATTAYVDSSVSGKMDSSSMTAYALSSNVSGVIDTVSSNSASWASSVVTATAGINSTVTAINGSALGADTANTGYTAWYDKNGRALTGLEAASSVSAFKSAVSANSATWNGKQDALTFGYNADNKISSIDGSALADVPDYSSESSTVLISGQNLEGTKSAVVSSVISGVNITPDDVTLSSNYPDFYKSAVLWSGEPLQDAADLSLQVYATQQVQTSNPKFTVGYSAGGVGTWGSTSTITASASNEAQTYSLQLPSGTTKVIVSGGYKPNEYQYELQGIFAKDSVISSDSTTAWNRIELASVDEIHAIESSNSAFQSAISNQVANINHRVDGAFFTTAWDTMSSVTGRETDFKVLYTPCSIASSTTAFAPIDSEIAKTGSQFLPEHDTGEYEDWFFTAGTGYIAVSGTSYAEWSANQKLTVVASGFCHDTADNVTARAMSAYDNRVSGTALPSGYLLDNGVIMWPSFTATSYGDNHGYLWTASASGAVPIVSHAGAHGALVPSGFTGTAVVGVSKYDFHPESGDTISAWVTLDGWTGTSVNVTSTDFCVVPSYDKFNQLWNWATANGFTP